MRLLFSFLFVFHLSSVFGQSEEQSFLEAKKYLVFGLNETVAEGSRVGLWKLSPAQGVRYGLVVVDGYDERRDQLWSTKAALNWYEDLVDQFKDSTLADIAVVMGPSVAYRASYNAMLYERWESRFQRWRNQSATLIPVDLDALSINEEPVLGPVYWQDVDSVLTLTRWRDIQQYNPAITGGRLPNGVNATLRLESNVTVDDMERLWALAEKHDGETQQELAEIRKRIENNIPDPSTHTRIAYRVRSGDVIGAIAQRYRVSLSDLKRWNSLTSNLIRIGQELVIYVPRGVEVAQVTQETVAQNEGQVRSDEEDRTEVQYRVKSGDTLWSIARNYPGISADDIMRWNGISEDIREGQMIMILVNNPRQE